MILLFILLFWCLPGLYVARLERNSFNYYWFNKFGTEYYDDFPDNLDNMNYVMGFIGGLLGILISYFIMGYFNPNSNFYLLRFKWRWKYQH